jgi:hypothetical protein
LLDIYSRFNRKLNFNPENPSGERSNATIEPIVAAAFAVDR